jgi:hypothetical protein
VEVEVGRICLDLEELVVGHHSRCDGLPLLAVDTKYGPPHRRRDGRSVGLARTSPTLLTGGRKATHVRCVLRSRSLTWQWSIHDPAYLSSSTRCGEPWSNNGGSSMMILVVRTGAMQLSGNGLPRTLLLETVWKVRQGGEVVCCQEKMTTQKGLFCALHATADPLWRASRRLSRQSLNEVG